MRVLYFSSDSFGLPLLKALAGGHLVGAELAGVVTTPPARSGRGMEEKPTVIEEFVRDHEREIPLFAPASLKGNTELRDEFLELEPDGLLAASYGKLITGEYLAMTGWPLCFHPSALPELRGPSPVRTALLEGREETALSLFCMTEELDEGPVLLQEPVEIGANETFGELNEKLAGLTTEVFQEAVELIEADEYELTDQEDEAATFTEKIEKPDTYLDFSRAATELHNQIRAFNPDLGTACRFRGNRLKIWESLVLVEDFDLTPGEIKVTDDRDLLVGTGSDLLEVLEVQPAGKQQMTALDFVNGYQPDGEVLEPIDD